MTRVAILSPSLTTADAVSNDALGMFGVLTRRGHDVRLFSETHSLPHAHIYDVAKLESFIKSSDDILLYHYARGWNRGLDLLRELRCRRVIKYHNVTPAKYFAGFNSTDQELCEAGRKQLVDVVAAQCDLYLSASAFSMQELLELGAAPAKTFVVPPFHHIDRLAQITADPQTLRRNSEVHAHILSVGRVAPHKGLLQLIEVFAHYYHGYNSKSRLIVVGKGGEGFSSYSRLLHRAVDKLDLTDAVVFTGGVSDEILKAYYQLADAYVTTSEHEGFCVPLVEAMSMRLPIAAYAAAAIPETLGDAGIAWKDRDPLLLAETIHLFLQDSAVRDALAERGRHRYEAMFSNEKIESTFLEAMATLQ
ncbi:MAG TPA: glycosyltransferase [Pyrinomonadaceae bacterium]|nr:glycosyltransferase [Pyrinomonadaceae bacterium]